MRLYSVHRSALIQVDCAHGSAISDRQLTSTGDCEQEGFVTLINIAILLMLHRVCALIHVDFNRFGRRAPMRHSRTRSATALVIWMCSLVYLNPWVEAQSAPSKVPQIVESPNRGGSTTELAGELQLARLVDLCAARLSLNIDYESSKLQRTITLRLAGPVSDAELWQLMNRMLNRYSMTSIQTNPSRFPRAYTIVDLADARALSGTRDRSAEHFSGDRNEHSIENPPMAGYSTLLIRIQYLTPDVAIRSIKPFLSNQGSEIVSIGNDGLVLLSDVEPRLQQAIAILQHIDIEGPPTTMRRIPLSHLTATQLATTLTSLSASRNSLDESMRMRIWGQVFADPDDRSIVVVAPQDELLYWESLIAEFDAAPERLSRTYTPRYFALNDVAALIQRTLEATQLNTSAATADRITIVEDALTSSLIVVATPRQHLEIASVLNRLNEAPAESRRPLRTFTIENRAVADVLEILRELIEGGVLENASQPLEQTFADTTDSRLQPTMATPNGRRATDATARIEAAQTDVSDEQSQTGVGRNQFGNAPSIWLTADKGTNTIIAIGEPRRLVQLEELINTLDVRQAQVMIEAMIVVLNDGQSLDLGVELQKFEVFGSTELNLSSLFGLSTIGDDGMPTLNSPRGGTAIVLNPGDFSVVIRALQTVSHGRILNIPKVLVNNNEQATLESVLQEPFLSTNASDTVATTSFGGTADAGTTIAVKPQIAEGDFLILEYTASLSTFVGESADPSIPPPKQQNSLSSVATIPDGYVIMAGGLEVTSEGDSVSKVPFLGDIPGLGALFQTTSKSASTSRFYVFIRPTIMRNTEFETLKYVSAQDARNAVIESGWPIVKPQIMR